jgi:hydroxyacylglutathione hydrolase
MILDVRPAAQFGAGHVPGSVNIALGGQFASWAATIIGLGRPVVLVAESMQEVAEARTRLARVGIENVIGYLEGGIAAWAAAGQPLAEIPQIGVTDLSAELDQRAGSLQVLDVRREPEWRAGHIEGAIHIPLDALSLSDPHADLGAGVLPGEPAGQRIAATLSALDQDKPVAVHCKGGYRSSIATGILERAGFRNVMNVTGGFDAWQSANLPITTENLDQAREVSARVHSGA